MVDGVLRILRLTRAHGKSAFSCGEPTLDAYLSKFAWQHEQRGIARVYVLEHATNGVVGFYTLSARSLSRAHIQGTVTHTLPTFPIPVFYIGSFAVAESEQRRGYGRHLLGDALHRCARGAETIGAHGVYLDSLSARSTQFYTTMGFVAVGPAITPQPMYLPMSIIRKASSA